VPDGDPCLPLSTFVSGTRRARPHTSIGFAQNPTGPLDAMISRLRTWPPYIAIT
jgi:hypothetical protein